MLWHFSDGTVAHLGGRIEGGTYFAQELRYAMVRPLLPDGPIPCGSFPADLKNPSHFDFIVRQEMDRPCNKWMMVSLVSAPEVEPFLILDTTPEDDPDNMLY